MEYIAATHCPELGTRKPKNSPKRSGEKREKK
jgi:hypothetical protein